VSGEVPCRVRTWGPSETGKDRRGFGGLHDVSAGQGAGQPLKMIGPREGRVRHNQLDQRTSRHPCLIDREGRFVLPSSLHSLLPPPSPSSFFILILSFDRLVVRYPRISFPILHCTVAIDK
jgi:hypothetical protein